MTMPWPCRREALAAYQQLILAHGHYAAQLSRWHGSFPRDSFLILEAEEFFASPQSTMNKVFAFVGLEVDRHRRTREHETPATVAKPHRPPSRH